ncbi:TlpA disulfide reductase family protein [Ideonella sp.]|uniref:TlpA family protein disulfide reductase n=1 Tax=Ideonella sp. TaxID=1929293 RepID=UPI002B46F360|nr:TlpA disulfide reductase family protein [Ideonella sp.]HJV68717.1 TlpA disulfide reductase family protein [Ideonella sp.]
MNVSTNRRGLLAALAAGALGATAELRAQGAGDPPGAPRRPWPAGRPTPPLDLPAWEGGRIKLAALRGQVVVVNFWASWCEPCRTEMPSLELLAARHEADGLQVLAVNHRETDGAIRRYLAQWPITLTILRDVDGAAARDWQVRAFPTTVVIGRDGRVAFAVTGEVDWTGPTARAWITPLLRP